jgi:hypothetical protein
MKLESSRQSYEKLSNIGFSVNTSSGAELLHVDGQMDRRAHLTKLVVAFHNFANAPKNW